MTLKRIPGVEITRLFLPVKKDLSLIFRLVPSDNTLSYPIFSILRVRKRPISPAQKQQADKSLKNQRHCNGKSFEKMLVDFVSGEVSCSANISV
jgi:hypothetical protein